MRLKLRSSTKYVWVKTTERYYKIVSTKKSGNKMFWPPFKGKYFQLLDKTYGSLEKRILWLNHFGKQYTTKESAEIDIDNYGLEDCKVVKYDITYWPYKVRKTKGVVRNKKNCIMPVTPYSQVIDIRILDKAKSEDETEAEFMSRYTEKKQAKGLFD